MEQRESINELLLIFPPNLFQSESKRKHLNNSFSKGQLKMFFKTVNRVTRICWFVVKPFDDRLVVSKSAIVSPKIESTLTVQPSLHYPSNSATT
jgi:hypothetical protein